MVNPENNQVFPQPDPKLEEALRKLPPIEIDPETFLSVKCTLPTLPLLVSRIQEALYSENVHLREVADMIRNDPALVAQVLKIANSAYYSLPKEIADINLAIAYIGINEVYRIILSISIFDTLHTEDKVEFDQIRFHSHCMAMIAKYISQKCEPLLPMGELWSASILHDIGKIVYLKFFSDHFKIIDQYTKTHGTFFDDVAVSLGLPSSSYFGTLLCDHWQLPDKIKLACEKHEIKDLFEDESEGPIRAFIRVICIANLLTYLVMKPLSNENKEKIKEIVKSMMDWDDSEFMLIMGDVYELKAEAEKLI